MQGIPRPAVAPPIPAPAVSPSPPLPAASAPAVPAGDQWLYVQNKVRHGPVTLAELKALALAGKLLVSDMVFQTGWPRWKNAADVAELFPAKPAEDFEEEDDLEEELDEEEDEADDEEGEEEEIDVEPYLERAQQHRDRGDYAKALAEYEKLVEELPDEPEGYHGLAWVWATCPDARFRNGTGAVAYARRALELEAEAEEDEDSVMRGLEYQKALAAAQAEAGDFAAALTTIEAAIAKAPADEHARLGAFRVLFRMKKAFRETPLVKMPTS